MKLSRYFNLLFVLGLLLVMSSTSCGLFEDDDDPNMNVQIGDTLWVHDMTGSEYIFTGPSLAYGDNNETVYYSKSGGSINWTPSSIVAIDVTDGSQKWESPAMDLAGLSSEIVVGDDGTIYVIGWVTLYAINPSNGQFKWTWEVPTELTHSNGDPAFTHGQIGSLSLLNSGDLILGSVGSGVYSRGIYNISSTGMMNWYNLDANGTAVYSNIAVDANDNAYYYTEIAGKYKLASISGTTGVVRWMRDVTSWGSSGNNIVIDDNGSLICSVSLTEGEAFHMYKLSSADGAVEWKGSDEVSHSHKLIGPDGKIYQWNNGGVFTFTSGDGQKSNFGTLNANIMGAVINADNKFTVMHATDNVGAINTYNADGTADWHVGYNGILPQHMVITDKNKIIVFKTQGLVAFEGSASEASSGWPTRNHDYRNTNNVLK